jgi:hypothetical protein
MAHLVASGCETHSAAQSGKEMGSVYKPMSYLDKQRARVHVLWFRRNNKDYKEGWSAALSQVIIQLPRATSGK